MGVLDWEVGNQIISFGEIKKKKSYCCGVHCIHFVCFVEDIDHGIELSLSEAELLQHMLDISPLGVELWVAQIRHIHKNILKERNQMKAARR